MPDDTKQRFECSNPISPALCGCGDELTPERPTCPDCESPHVCRCGKRGAHRETAACEFPPGQAFRESPLGHNTPAVTPATPPDEVAHLRRLPICAMCGFEIRGGFHQGEMCRQIQCLRAALLTVRPYLRGTTNGRRIVAWVDDALEGTPLR